MSGPGTVRRRLRRSIVLALMLGMFVSASSARAAASPDYYGLSVQTLFNDIPSSSWSTYLKPMTWGGLTIGRVVANWSGAEPKPPDAHGHHTYSWNTMDTLATTLAQNGIRMYDVLEAPPPWAQSPSLAAHYDDLAAFAAAFAARYGVDGSFWAQHPELPYLPENDFEFWTEANSTHFWESSPDAAEYLKAFRLVSDAIHGVDPTARVLASVGWQDFLTFVGQLYTNGAKGLIGGIAFHPYSPIATGIIDLVRKLRLALDFVGDPTLPIDVTEIGQVVTYDGTGSKRAGEGNVTDAARAATQTLAGDALARSNCDVNNYVVYTIVGSETSNEPIGEGYMGVLHIDSGVPNITGAALIAASQRWRASQGWRALPSQGLFLCGAGKTPRSSLLPLQLGHLKHVSPTCATATTLYHGNPVESAQLTLRTADGRTRRYATDSMGFGKVCIPRGRGIHQFTVDTEIARIATSPTYYCNLRGSCGTGTYLRWRLGATILQARGHHGTVRALLTCKRIFRKNAVRKTKLRCPKHLRVTVLLRRHQRPAGRRTYPQRPLRHVTLRLGRKLTFHVKAQLNHLDSVVVRVARQRKQHIPKLQSAPTTSWKALRAARTTSSAG